MLVFCLGEVAQHLSWRSEEDEASPFVEQDRLMKHLKYLRARLMNRNNDDFVVRQCSNDFDHVLGILRRKSRSRFIKQINVRGPNHIEADVQTLAFPATQRLFDW